MFTFGIHAGDSLAGWFFKVLLLRWLAVCDPKELADNCQVNQRVIAVVAYPTLSPHAPHPKKNKNKKTTVYLSPKYLIFFLP